MRLKGRTTDEVTEKINWLVAGGLAIIPVDEAIGREAGRLHALWYDRTKRPLSMADCVALATATALGHAIATADRALAETGRADRVRSLPSPTAKEGDRLRRRTGCRGRHRVGRRAPGGARGCVSAMAWLAARRRGPSASELPGARGSPRLHPLLGVGSRTTSPPK